MACYSGSNAKLVILDYFDRLIQEVDIYTEKKLENTTNETEIPSQKSVDVGSKQQTDAYFKMDEEFVEVGSKHYDMSSFVDPYSDNYKYIVKTQCDSKSLRTTQTKVQGYLDRIREEIISELKRMQRDAIGYYETIREQINENGIICGKSDDFRERIKELALANESAFILRLNKNSADIKFNFYLVVLNFNLKKQQQELLKSLLSEKGLLISSSNIESQISTQISLDQSYLVVIMLAKYLSDLFKNKISPTQEPANLIRVEKSLLLSIPKLIVEYEHLDNIDLNIESESDAQDFDLSNLKSLCIFKQWNKMKNGEAKVKCSNLSSLQGLEYLIIRFAKFTCNPFSSSNSLAHMHKLVLVFCDFEHMPSEAFTDLPNLEILCNYYPENCSHLSYEHLQRLKWLRIESTNEFFFLADGRLTCPQLLTLELFESLTQSNSAHMYAHLTHKGLTNLSLNNNFLINFNAQWLVQLPSLRSLKLEKCELEEINFKWDHLKQLDELCLRNNHLSVLELAPFERLESLRSLDLSENELAKPLDGNIFAGLTKLEKLYLNNFGRSGKWTLDKQMLLHLGSLQLLDLECSELNRVIPRVFDHMSRLIHLNLSCNQLALDELTFAGLKCLKLIDLSQNELMVLPDNCFSELENLECLNLAVNNLVLLNGTTFHGLEKCLRLLDLKHNKIKFVDLETFDRFEKLEKVNLIFNSIGEELKANLTNFYKNRQVVFFFSDTIRD